MARMSETRGKVSELRKVGTDAYKVGQAIQYMHYGAEKTGVIARIGDSGIIFLTDGKFLHPESVLQK